MAGPNADMRNITDRWAEPRYADMSQAELRERVPNRYVVRVGSGAGRANKSYRYNQLREARAWRDSEKAKRSVQGVATSVDRSKRYMDELWKTYTETKLSKLRDTTRANRVTQYGNYIQPRWGDVPLRSITRQDVDRWAVGMLDAHGKAEAGPSTRWQVLGQFEAMMKYAADELGWIEYPVRASEHVRSGIKKSKDAGKREGAALDVRQAGLLVKHAGHYAPMLTFMLVCGLRIGEARELRVKDIDFGAGLARIERSASDVRGQGVVVGATKSGRNRRVPLSAQALAALDRVDVFRGCDADAERLVFRSPQGQRVSGGNFRRIAPAILSAATEEAQARGHYLPSQGVHLHDMRHTFRTWVGVAQGIPVAVADAIMGHSGGHVRETYTHVSDADIRAAGEVLSDYLGDTLTLPPATH